MLVFHLARKDPDVRKGCLLFLVVWNIPTLKEPKGQGKRTTADACRRLQKPDKYCFPQWGKIFKRGQRRKDLCRPGGDEEEGSEKAFWRCFLFSVPLFLSAGKKGDCLRLNSISRLFYSCIWTSPPPAEFCAGSCPQLIWACFPGIQ